MEYNRHAVHQYIQATSTLADIFLDLVSQRMSADDANKVIWFKHILNNEYYRQGYLSKLNSSIPAYYSDDPYRELLFYLKKWGWKIFRQSLLQIFKNKLHYLLTVEDFNSGTRMTVRNYITRIEENMPKDISTSDYINTLCKKEWKTD